jgi:tetratricopeptide (TPR) repeat protein
MIPLANVPVFDLVLGDDHPNTPKPRDKLGSWNRLAMSYLAAGRAADAVPLFERTLADCERVLGADHPNTLRSRNNLAMSYLAAGRTAKAISLLERTLADCERVLGADHPDTLASRDNLAMGYRAKR